jgi:hypothetical protein
MAFQPKTQQKADAQAQDIPWRVKELYEKGNVKGLSDLISQSEAAAMEVIKYPTVAAMELSPNQMRLAHMAVFKYENVAMASLSIHNPPVIPFIANSDSDGLLAAHYAVDHERVALEVLYHYPQIALARARNGWPVLFKMVLRHNSVAIAIQGNPQLKFNYKQGLGTDAVAARFEEILSRGSGQCIPTRR